MDHQEKRTPLLDSSTLTIIIIAIVVVVWAYFAKHLHDYTHSRALSAVEFHATVDGRIQPIGRVRLAGEDAAEDELQVAEVPAAEPVTTTLTGPQVFNEACNLCHGNGIGGAPMLNDSAGWAARVAQGNDVLYQHAIEGYTSPTGGYMPPKGGRLDLSDEEIVSAVDYMLSEVP